MIRIRKLMAAALILFLGGCATFMQQAQVKEWQDPLSGMEFVFVTEGCFQMGDTFGDGYEVEHPAHEVSVNGFWMGKYKVTQGQWEKVMGYNPSQFKNGATYPVENVNGQDAQEFIRRLNEMTGKRFRLPTEAEWEYAPRNGGRREKWAGTNSESELWKYAWYSGYSDGRTHLVGQKRPHGL